jgi:hypothetical protein
MNQGCAFNALTGSFTTEMTACEAAHFVVDKRNQLFQDRRGRPLASEQAIPLLANGGRAFISRSHRMSGNGQARFLRKHGPKGIAVQ